MQKIRGGSNFTVQLLNYFFNLSSFFSQLWSNDLCPFNQLRKIQSNNCQRLASAVMQFAGNTSSFLILNFHQARHVIGNSNLFCRLFLVMDVKTTAYIPFKRSVRRVARHSAIQYPAVLPGVMPHPVLHLKWTASIEVADVDLQAAVEVFRMHVLRPAIA